MVIGGGRIVQAIWNWATQKPQPLCDSEGNYIDFLATLALLLPPPNQQFRIEDDKPTTPRPATTTTTVRQANNDHNDQDSVQQAMSSMQQALAPGRDRASQSVSIHSQSPHTHTPVAALLPEPTNNDNDDDTALTDAKTKADREKIGKGKWGDKKEIEKDDLVNENNLLKKCIL